MQRSRLLLAWILKTTCVATVLCPSVTMASAPRQQPDPQSAQQFQAHQAGGQPPATLHRTLEDISCEWSFRSWRCEPAKYCSFKYHHGDVSFHENCQLKSSGLQYPHQIHLAYAGQQTGTGMTISWATFASVKDSVVWIGDSKDHVVRRNDVPVAEVSYYQDETYAIFEHHATVLGLQPKTKYFYKVGSATQPDLQSEVYSFTTARTADQDDSFEIAIIGDNGRCPNAYTTLALINSVADQVEMAYHLGDISYADNAIYNAREFFEFFYEEAYNQWFNALSPFLSKVPYMVMVGNHEAECHSPYCLFSTHKKDSLGNYTAYNTRFKMPSQESGGVLNMWYSFEHGPIHFTSASSETDYPGAPTNAFTFTHTNGNFGDQLAWLEQDLKKAHANRDKVPWLVVGLHRPMYSIHECDETGQSIGVAAVIQSAFEDLLIKYKVDVVLTGHKHWYERHFPIAYNKAVMDGVTNDNKLYVNPKAPVHIVNGAGGNEEGHQMPGIVDGPIDWNAFLVPRDFGINTVKVNRTVLEWKFIGSDTQQVLDEFTIVKKP